MAISEVCAAFLKYKAAIAAADNAANRAVEAKWLQIADDWLVRYLILADKDTSCWFVRTWPDHVPVDRRRWGAKKRAQF
jgi:hypothetical protein